ncbi:transposable element Tcb2 transposase [Trichonephila clavipes]|uniref:Transposable element Tcb2 transposase n=1 Tax=Trichonephila clavipes TaxID=2585209 RepID=A0A8X7BLB9_TRICX|nr:transposable element Tcb2 transposase [Trichonephila clavipes]
MQRNSSIMMRVWKQWTNKHRTTRKTGHGRRKMTSALDDRHLLRMAGNERRASSKQLAARWSTATGVLMILLTANHRRMCLQWAHEHRAWQADWHQVVFSDESRLNLWDHDGRIRVRRMSVNAAFQSALSNDIVA